MPVFVDSNVLVYARDAGEAIKQPQALAWLEHLWRTRSGRLSFQVLQEFYVTVTKKFDPGLTPADAREEVRSFLAWRPLAVDDEMLEAAWALQDHHSLSFWDALILGAAQASGCQRVLSEDFSDGEIYGGVEVVNPFTQRPG